MPTALTSEDFTAWASDRRGPVALHLREDLLPVEGRGAVFFPPTYAGLQGSYNIDTLEDGTRVALVDSVGAQANRIEPLFAEEEELRGLVPQITVRYGDADKATDGKISLMQAGHRLGDALVRATELGEEAHGAFMSFLRENNASRLARVAPTSLVFGVWDSRDTMAKVPRLLQSTIRAWDVSRLSRSAQYVPALDYAALDVFSETDKEKAEEKAVKGGKDPLAQRGYVHVPATDSHGGVVATGPIRRDLTINLVQLRRLNAAEETKSLREYLLGLALVAATEPVDSFLRQGCLLVPDDEQPPIWTLITRKGERQQVSLPSGTVRKFAENAAKSFGVGESREVAFDKKLAGKDAKKQAKK